MHIFSLKNNVIFIAIFILAIIAYLPSLYVPFYLDDFPSIANNPAFNHGSVESLFQIYGMRFIGYLSFYVNYLISTQETFSYHIVNLLIHLLNALVLYKLYFVLCTFLNIKSNKLFILLAVAIWLLHPLNTQAVTYIVQRLASLVTLFTLLSLLGYLKCRVELKKRWLLFSLVAFVLACLTKQNAIFLPLFIILIELTYSTVKVKSTLWYSISASFFIFILVYPFIPEVIHALDIATREAKDISRIDYFNSQLFIHFVYLKKFLLIEPLTLTVDAHIIKDELFIFTCYLFHAAIMLTAYIQRHKYKLFTLSVIFYYCAHLVESSIIPITDLAFEHRTYLPNMALSFIVVMLLQLLAIKSKLSKQTIFVISVIGVVILSILTFKRNIMWQQPEVLYYHDYIAAPENPRNLEVMGMFYAQNNDLEKAAELLRQSVKINLEQGRLTATSVTNLMRIYSEQNNFQAAVITGQKALRHIKTPLSRSLVLSAMAFSYTKMGICDFGKGLANAAYKLNNNNMEAIRVMKYCKKIENKLN